MGIRAEISKRDATFTETERKIASFFLNCGDELGQMSSAEAARHIGVSQSTVIKFVQKVASCGFVEFKMKLYEERMRLNRQVKSPGGDVTLASPINDVIGAIYQETIASLRQTYENLDQNAVLQAIDLLEHAERIFICGKGASFFPAQDLASKLMKFGLTVICIEDLETMELGALVARSADVYLFQFEQARGDGFACRHCYG